MTQQPQSEFLKRLAEASSASKAASSSQVVDNSTKIGRRPSVEVVFARKAKAEALEARRQQLAARPRPSANSRHSKALEAKETPKEVPKPKPARVVTELPRLQTSARSFVRQLAGRGGIATAVSQVSARNASTAANTSPKEVTPNFVRQLPSRTPDLPPATLKAISAVDPPTRNSEPARFNSRFAVPQQTPASESIKPSNADAVAVAEETTLSRNLPTRSSLFAKSIAPRPVALKNVSAATLSSHQGSSRAAIFQMQKSIQRGPPEASSKQIAPESLPLGAVKSAKKGCGCGRK